MSCRPLLYVLIMGEEIVIKQVGVEAIDTIRSVAEIAFRETYKELLSVEQIDYMMEWMYSEESLKRQMTETQNSFFIVMLNDSCVGYAAIRPDVETSSETLSVYHLEKIYLLPKVQGKGIGARLIDRVCQFVKNLSGAKSVIELNVNRNNVAKGFYEKMGFFVVSEGDFPIGNGFFMNDFIMRMEL